MSKLQTTGQPFNTNFSQPNFDTLKVIKNRFSFAHLNIRGITSKIDEVRHISSTYNFSIFSLSENFLDGNKPDSFYQIPS